MCGEGFRQKHGRPQIDGVLKGPLIYRQGVDPVVKKECGTVDQQIGSAQGGGASRHERLNLGGVREIGFKGNRLPAVRQDFGDDALGVTTRSPVMNADAPSMAGEIECDSFADTAPRASYERDPGVLLRCHYNRYSRNIT
jgi:hypothetical protein